MWISIEQGNKIVYYVMIVRVKDFAWTMKCKQKENEK